MQLLAAAAARVTMPLLLPLPPAVKAVQPTMDEVLAMLEMVGFDEEKQVKQGFREIRNRLSAD
jgi:hypothetical protein